MLRRLHSEQPESFAFTSANHAWAEAQITKYPQGREASAIIPLLWRAQEQEGWLTRPAIEHVADMLGLAYIRALEVASFYFMFQLQPVGSVAHIQVCGTTSCMICGAEDLVAVCKDKIAPNAHQLSADGKFSWEEVECLGSCANAPMAQIGKDYYEDLTAARMGEILAELADGKVPVPGPQSGRFAAEPKAGLTSLTEFKGERTQHNASVQLATDLGETIKRIDGTEVPLLAPWGDAGGRSAIQANWSEPPSAVKDVAANNAAPHADVAAPETSEPGVALKPSAPLAGQAELAARKGVWRYEPSATTDAEPETLSAARGGQADDLKLLKGVGPKLEQTLNGLGIYHFDQIAAWTDADTAWVDMRLKFKGRIRRDGWIAQAGQLASGEDTEFSKRAKEEDAEQE